MKLLFNTNENTLNNFDRLPEEEMSQLKGGFDPKEKDIWEPEDK